MSSSINDLQRRKSVFLIFSTWCLSTFCVYVFMMAGNPDYQFEFQFGPRDQFVPVADEEPQKSKVPLDRNFFDYLAYSMRSAKFESVDNYIQYAQARLKLKPLTNIHPIRTDIGPVLNNLTNLQYPINRKACSKSIGTEKTSIFIAVVSKANHTGHRDTIRQTWRQQLDRKVIKRLIDVAGFAFIVGTTNDTEIQRSILKEQSIHGDIIQVNFMDSLDNLTLKSVSILNWIVQYCPLVQFVMKTEESVYINVRNLAATIRTLSPADQSIYGKIVIGDSLSRDKNNFPYEEWPWSSFPDHVDGSCYLISRSAVVPLLAAAQVTPFFVKENIYLSGLCTKKVGISIRSSKRMLISDEPLEVPDVCLIKQTVSWVTNSTTAQMNESQIITENFYGGDKICNTTANVTRTSQSPDDPSNYIVTLFKLI